MNAEVQSNSDIAIRMFSILNSNRISVLVPLCGVGDIAVKLRVALKYRD